MSQHDQNLAVMESRIDSTERNLEKLTQVVQELAKVASDTAHAVSLIQQAQTIDNSGQAEIKADIVSIKEKTNMLRGGWMALCVIGAAIVGLAGVVGALCTALAMRHP